jgi:hypothetical protein
MHSLAVVPLCDVIHDILLCCISRPIIAPVNSYLFQAAKKVFATISSQQHLFYLCGLKNHVFSVPVDIDDSYIERLDLNVLSTLL